MAVVFSVLLEWLRAEQFYLKYPALTLEKFCSVGIWGSDYFMFISMEIGDTSKAIVISHIIIKALITMSITNEVFRKSISILKDKQIRASLVPTENVQYVDF